MSTQTLYDVDIDPVTGKGRVTHIIKQTRDKTAAELVMESRINGRELEALCGHRFFATRDSKQYPVCQPCKEAYDAKVSADKGLPEHS